jgi:RNA polymerase sigma factor (sigma-70 family)
MTPPALPETETANGGSEGEGCLLERHTSGDREAFAELVGLYRAPVYSYLIRTGVAEEDRDDLFQEVFVRVHKAASSYTPSRPLHPWLFTIVANAVRTYHRRRRVRMLVHNDPPAQDPECSRPGSERTTAARQLLEWLEGQIQRLPLIRREVLILACIEGMALKDVAASLRMPVNTVKTHLRRARLFLAEELAQHGRAEGES